MRIEKGDKFLCIKDVVMDNGVIEYYAGKTYVSEKDGCITNESGEIEHSWIDTEDEDLPEYYFSPITSKVPLLEEDNVNHPSHYADNPKGIECIDAMEAGLGKERVMAFCLCNAFKYIFRTQKKNGLEDVKKAIWYLNKFVSLYEGV